MKRSKRQAGSTAGSGGGMGPIQLAKIEPQERAMPSVTVAAQTKEQRKRAGTWLKDLRQRAGLSQIELAQRLGFKYYTFVSQIENGFGRVPTESMEAWARQLGAEPARFARELLSYYEPELHRLLFEVKK